MTRVLPCHFGRSGYHPPLVIHRVGGVKYRGRSSVRAASLPKTKVRGLAAATVLADSGVCDLLALHVETV